MDKETPVNYPLFIWDTLVMKHIVKAKIKEQQKEYYRLKKELSDLRVHHFESSTISVSLLSVQSNCSIRNKQHNLILLLDIGVNV